MSARKPRTTKAAPASAEESASTTVAVMEPEVIIDLPPMDAPTDGRTSDQPADLSWTDVVKVLRKGFATDARKLKALDAMRDAMLDFRVDIVRATVVAMAFPESHAKAGKTAGQPSQSVVAEAIGINRLTFTPFWKAAMAHAEKYQGSVAGEPTDAERELVASFWKGEALRARARREATARKAEKTDAPKAKGETAGGSSGTTEGETDGRTSVPEDVKVADVLAAVSQLELVMTAYTRELGFDRATADAIAEKLATIGATLESHTV